MRETGTGMGKTAVKWPVGWQYAGACLAADWVQRGEMGKPDPFTVLLLMDREGGGGYITMAIQGGGGGGHG
jgi:hypothetical protein